MILEKELEKVFFKKYQLLYGVVWCGVIWCLLVWCQMVLSQCLNTGKSTRQLMLAEQDQLIIDRQFDS